MAYPLPNDVALALQQSTPISGHIDVLAAGTLIQVVPIETGSVTADRTSQSRRTAKVTCVDTEGLVAPMSSTDPLAANGNEFRVWYDVYYGPGRSQVYSINMGTFTITTTTVTDTGDDLQVTVEGTDRSWDFLQRKFVQPYTVAAGQNVDQAIMDMLNEAWTGNGPLQFNLAPTAAATPAPAAVLAQGKDPWTESTLLANSAGFELFPDVFGTIVGRPTPDPTQASQVWQFSELAPTSMKGLTRVFTRQGVYSAFEVVGKGSATSTNPKTGKKSIKSVPLLAYTEDDNPLSPTYAKGKFGVVPNVQNSTEVTSQAQGDAMVATQLAQEKGKIEQLTVAGIPNPALDIDDVVWVWRSRMGVGGLYVIDSITCDIHYDATMTLVCRPVYPQ